MSETMKLLGITKNKISKDKTGENVPYIESTEVLLMHCNIVNYDYQQDLGEVFDVSPKTFIFLKNFESEFSFIEPWFTDQNSKPLEVEDKINITLVIN